jgi:hypothetical protein
MSWEYSCPKCKCMLNPDRSIILTVQYQNVRALVGFHPKPGQYEVQLPPGMAAENGTKWDFICPVCQVNLKTSEDPNLCELALRMDDQQLRILFSRIAGEHATFILNEGTLKEKHGKDLNRYNLRWGQTKYLEG